MKFSFGGVILIYMIIGGIIVENIKKKAVFVMLLTIFVWGVSFLSIKIVVQVIPPMTQGAIRFLIASAILVAVKKIKRNTSKIAIEDYKYLFAVGAIGISLYFYFENSSMLYLPTSIAGILIATIPIFTMISDAIFYKVNISKIKWIGVLLSLVGVYLIVSNQELGAEMNKGIFAMGLFMMAGAIFSWIVYAMFMKKLSYKYDSLTITCYQSIVGAVCFLPFSFREQVIWSKVDVTIVMNIIFLSVVCSAMAFLGYNFAVAKLGASESSIYLNIMPVVTMVSGVLIFKEELTLIQILGSALVLLSIYIVEHGLKNNKVGKRILRDKAS